MLEPEPRTTRVPRKSGYLPGLDGLRALAIVGVLMAHDSAWTIAGHSNAAWKGFGGWGVELFFAISGVLICWRLLEEEQRSGSIRLRDFYVRRLLRIQPAALCYLFAIAALGLAGTLPHNWRLWWSAVLSYINFLVTANTAPGPAAFIGHFWTLSVEEHFYVLISLLFLMARRRRTLLLGALLAVLLLVQILAAKHGLYKGAESDRRTYWNIQYLLTPALMAMLVRRPAVRQWVQSYLKPWTVPVLTFLAIWPWLLSRSVHLTLNLLQHPSLLKLLGYGDVVLFYGFGLWVVAIMLHPESLTTRWLEIRALRFVGRLSYSIYLWHVLFYVPEALPEQIHSSTLLLLSGRPWRYMATAVLALCSYYLVEKPLMRLGHRLAPPATAGHRDLETADSAASGQLRAV